MHARLREQEIGSNGKIDESCLAICGIVPEITEGF